LVADDFAVHDHGFAELVGLWNGLIHQPFLSSSRVTPISR
jgi:hypothetical protein